MKEEWKIYIRGNEDRGEEVIKALTDLGGKVDALKGSNKDCIYFINHDDVIDFAYLVSETAQIIMDNYTELHLPEKWKDGDVLVSRYNSQVMALYEFVSDKDADLFNAYFRIDDHMIFSHSLEVRNRFRLATDKEIERFYELLHKHHKDWDAKKKQVVDWKWEPKENDNYYCFDTNGEVANYTWDGDNFDAECYNFGNCFRTEEEAEAMAEKVKKLLKGE